MKAIFHTMFSDHDFFLSQLFPHSPLLPTNSMPFLSLFQKENKFYEKKVYKYKY